LTAPYVICATIRKGGADRGGPEQRLGDGYSNKLLTAIRKPVVEARNQLAKEARDLDSNTLDFDPRYVLIPSSLTLRGALTPRSRAPRSSPTAGRSRRTLSVLLINKTGYS
jgi:hypothetical protein